MDQKINYNELDLHETGSFDINKKNEEKLEKENRALECQENDTLKDSVATSSQGKVDQLRLQVVRWSGSIQPPEQIMLIHGIPVITSTDGKGDIVTMLTRRGESSISPSSNLGTNVSTNRRSTRCTAHFPERLSRTWCCPQTPKPHR